MSPFVTATLFQSFFGVLLAFPIIILWVLAAVDVFRHHFSGLKIAACLVMILIVPILGPILYFVFVHRESMSGDAGEAEAAYLAQESMRHEAASRPIGGTSYR